jgi:hypothetical protein
VHSITDILSNETLYERIAQSLQWSRYGLEEQGIPAAVDISVFAIPTPDLAAYPASCPMSIKTLTARVKSTGALH